MNNSFKDLVSGLRCSWTWLGLEKTVEEEFLQEFKTNTASSSDATTTTKTIVNPRNEFYKNLTKLRSQISSYYRSNTLPYLEKGIRLCSRDRLLEITNQLEVYRKTLKEKEKEFEDNWNTIKEDCKTYLGKLFNPSNYPASFIDVFDVKVEAVNLEPPSYLMELAPEEYAKMQKILEERIEGSLKLHDQLLQESFVGLIENLSDKLKPNEDGSKKRIESSAVKKIQTFFEDYKQFRELSKELREDGKFDELVHKVNKTLEGFDVEGIRASQKLREILAKNFESINQELQSVVVTKKRKVMGPDITCPE